MTSSRRAEPLSATDRRSAIARAILPLLLKRGAAATSRELAEAAGVAEGTLFNVFGTKRDMILAAIERHLDPDPITERLGAIPGDLPLAEKLAVAADTITSTSKDTIVLLGILHTMPGDRQPGDNQPPAFMREWHRALTQATIRLLEQHESELRTGADRASIVFSSLLMTAIKPYRDCTPSLESREIVDIFLNGILTGGAIDAA